MMKIPLTVGCVFITVTVCALIGMVMGGAFGYAAGRIGPDLFENMFPWTEFEPAGVATVLGAFGGVICGGCLGVFAVLMQWLGERGRG